MQVRPTFDNRSPTASAGILVAAEGCPAYNVAMLILSGWAEFGPKIPIKLTKYPCTLRLEAASSLRLIRLAALFVAIIAVTVFSLIRFRGLSTAEGMDQAQIAREIARGNGFTTKTTRPLEYWGAAARGQAVYAGGAAGLVTTSPSEKHCINLVLPRLALAGGTPSLCSGAKRAAREQVRQRRRRKRPALVLQLPILQRADHLRRKPVPRAISRAICA